MFRDKLRRLTGLIITILVVVACIILIATRSDSNKDDGRSGGNPTAPVQSPAQVPSSSAPEQMLSPRVLEFEAAYLIADPAKRLAALKPYATPEFLATLPKKIGNSPAEQSAIKLNYVIDGNSWIDAELMDPSTIYVVATLGVTSYADKTEVNTYQIKHETVWVKSANGQWFAYAEGQSRGDSP